MTIRDQVINFVEKQGEATRKDIIRFIVCDIKHAVTKEDFDKNYSRDWRGYFSSYFSPEYCNKGCPILFYPNGKSKKHLCRIGKGHFAVTTAKPIPTPIEARHIGYRYNY